MFTGPLVGVDAFHHLAVDDDLALGRVLESREHAQQRRLAAAGGAEQGEEFAFGNVEVRVVDGDDGSRRIASRCCGSR